MAASLTPGFQVLALKIQEAAMVQSDVRARLSDAVNDAHKESGEWGYYIDHTGDGESGDCIYCCNGDIRSAPYELSSVGGKQTAHIDMDNSSNVVPRTTYEEEADEDDHYAGMSEAFVKSNIYTELPLYERFISKSERDAADEGSFAGKGKSFPILKPSDVGAAVHAMGRAGSGNYGMAQLKANIIRIAKAKGWTKYLPKTWRGDATQSESIRPSSVTASEVYREPLANPLKLVESAATLENIVLKEAKADYEIKLIAPGKGSSAFYPAEVLRRDGPKVFTAGTHVYLNHPTAAEEAARPEGDVKNLAGVLSTAAAYHESHAKGPGLYARMKVFADHATTVEERAPHVGMSIRASGVAEAKKMHEGLPVLKELTSAESVDVVTRAGAGGMILTEAARPGNTQEVSDMDAAALTKLQESLNAGLASLALREARMDAKEKAVKALESLRLPPEAKDEIQTRVMENIPVKDGALDEVKFTESLKAEIQRIGRLTAALTGNGKVIGMGPSMPVSEADQKSQRKQEKRAFKEARSFVEEERNIFAEITGLPVKEKEVA